MAEPLLVLPLDGPRAVLQFCEARERERLQKEKIDMKYFALPLLLCALPASAETLYKCIDGAGQVTYQDAPCATPGEQAHVFNFSGAENRGPALAPPLPPGPPVNIYNNYGGAPPLPPPAYPDPMAAAAAWKYAREQAAREARNCQVMGDCPTPMDRALREQMYVPPPPTDFERAAAQNYAREQAEQELRNCQVMNICPTSLDRVRILQRYGFASDVDVTQCARYQDSVYCLGQ